MVRGHPGRLSRLRAGRAGARTAVGDLSLDLARRYAAALRGDGAAAGPPSRRPLSSATRRGYLVALKAFAGWLRRERYLTRDPLAGLVVPRAEELLFPVFNDQQVGALLAETGGDSLRARRWAAVVWLLLDGDLCLSEPAELSAARLDVERGEARVLGKSWAEALRCLKHRVSRPVFRLLQAGQSEWAIAA